MGETSSWRPGKGGGGIVYGTVRGCPGRGIKSGL